MGAAAAGVRRLLEDGCARSDAAQADSLLIGSVPFATEAVASILSGTGTLFLRLVRARWLISETDVRTLARLANRANAGEKLDTRDAIES